MQNNYATRAAQDGFLLASYFVGAAFGSIAYLVDSVRNHYPVTLIGFMICTWAGAFTLSIIRLIAMRIANYFTEPEG